MKRLLILGGGGMLGHKLWQLALPRFETKATVRSAARFRGYGFPAESILAPVDVNDFNQVVRAVAAAKPDVIVNCIGVVKQLAAAKDPLTSIALNSLLPHQLAELAAAAGARLIHISTDCVFSGRKGMYTEADQPDAEDLYGRSKLLGEVDRDGALTLRTSIIGRELTSANGLVEWFLSRRGQAAKGFAKAVFSGFPTQALAKIIFDVIEHHPALSGVYQVSAAPIDKYELLLMLDRAFDAHVDVQRDEAVVIDRSLDSTRFRTATGFVPPSWDAMIAELAADPTPYDQWRNSL